MWAATSLLARPSTPLQCRVSSAGRPSKALIAAVQEANTAVWERGRAEPDLRGMGTTLTAAALIEIQGGEGDRLVFVNVGDSRAYRLQEGHSRAAHSRPLGRRGIGCAGRADAGRGSAHILTVTSSRECSVSLRSSTSTPGSSSPQVGDRYLICSDGFSNEVGRRI